MDTGSEFTAPSGERLTVKVEFARRSITLILLSEFEPVFDGELPISCGHTESIADEIINTLIAGNMENYLEI